MWLSASISTPGSITRKAVVIPRERSESRDLGTKFTANVAVSA